MQPMAPIRDGLEIVLRLLRASGRPEAQLARSGAFQLTMAGRTAQMLRLRLARPKANIVDAEMIAALHGALIAQARAR